MAYYDKILQPGEQVVYVGHLHWIIFLHAKLFGILAVCAAIAGYVLLQPLLYLVAGGLLVIALLIALPVLLRRISTEMVVTNHRVIRKVGLISRRTMEINVSKIETVDVIQSLMGRLFGYGTILIRGTGSTYDPMVDVADPLAFRRAIVAE